MKVFIDIYHLPQFNFFRNSILALKKNEVDLCVIDRGRLVKIIKNDCPGYNLIVLGDYKRNKGPFSMLFRIIIPRFFNLLRIIKRSKYDFVVTAHYQANLVAWLRRIPNLAFIDDPRKIAFDIDKLSTNELYIPCFSEDIPKTIKFNALKEWAYLSPKYFTPNIAVLKEYKLEPKGYIFIREVDTKSSNYLGQEEDIILGITKKHTFEDKVVLSLEKKQNKAKYPNNWTILEEPVSDIHSLMFYSKTVISSGDSMAREGGMLGVHSIYCGFRDMPANNVLIEKGILSKVAPEKLINSIEKIENDDESIKKQEAFRSKLEEEWDDATELILRKIREYTNEKK